MKKPIIVMSIAAGLLALSGCSSTTSATTGKIIAETKVGSVTEDDLITELKANYGDQVEEALQSVLLTKILSKEFKVNEKEINEEINKDKEKMAEQFDEAIQKSQYKTFENYKRGIKLSLLLEKAAKKNLKISDEDLKKYYETWQPEIRASHILVLDEETAKEVKTKLDNGGSFEKLAQEYSNDEPTAVWGGDLGWFKSGEMDPKFEEAAYKLKVNEISSPIETVHGWHIIQLTDKKEKESFVKLRKELEKKYVLDHADPNEIISKALKESNIKVKDKNLKNTFDTILKKVSEKDTTKK